MATVRLQEILASRDLREQTVEEFFSEGIDSMVVATMNIPGSEKNSLIISRAFDMAMQDLFSELGSGQLLPLQKTSAETGPCAMFLIEGGNTVQGMKQQLVQFESTHPIGRWLDLDVKQKGDTAVSRASLGLPERTCFLCGEKSTVCRRNPTHTVKELCSFTSDHLKSYVAGNASYHPDYI